jgi:hypothetical protein
MTSLRFPPPTTSVAGVEKVVGGEEQCKRY